MPPRLDLPPDDVIDQSEPFSPGARLGWWGGYVVLILIGFCFGVWAGTQRKTVETVAAPAEKADPKPADPPAPEPVAKKDLTPEPKKGPELREPEPKKTPEPELVTLVPKKAPEPKKAAEPKSPMVKEVLFAKEVLPIFKSKCTLCHGDTKGLKGDLDLRTVAAIMKGGDGGPGVKAGDLKAGTVWASVEDGSMPPAGKEQLTDAEKTIIRNWILSGAK